MRFFLFLTFFLSLYGGLHLYWYAKLKRAFAIGPKASAGCLLFILVMLLAPIVTRILERNHLELSARSLAYVGYIWMGYLFLFFAFGLATDAYRILVAGTTRLTGVGTLWQLSARQAFCLPLVVALVAVCVGYHSACNIGVEKVSLQTPKLSSEVGRLKIAQISDVHLGLVVGAGRLQKIVKVIAAEKPDLLVSTGDLIDGRFKAMTGLAPLIRSIPTPLGKYAVTGNHEFYAGLPMALEVTRQAEVEDDRLTLRRHHDVAGLEISVDHAALMRVLHCFTDPGEQR